MNLKNKPQGYVSVFTSHGDPANSPPPIKLIQVKQEETLLGANIKSFIKERLFGNFINYTKLHNARKYNFTPPISSLTEISDGDIIEDPMKSAPMIRQNYKHRINDLRTTIQKKINERYSNPGDKMVQKPVKNRIKHRNSLGSNLQESTLLNSQRTKVNRANHSKRSLNASRVDRNHSYDFEKYPAPSFISAIDDSQSHSKIQHSGRRQVKLSPINNKAELINKLEIVKNNLTQMNSQFKKSPKRMQIQRFDIIQNVWQLFCQPLKQKTQKNPKFLNDSTIMKEFQSIKINESFISVPRSIENRMSDLGMNSLSIQKSKYSLAKTYFIKQAYLQYLNNKKYTYPPLASLYFSFFEINSKLYDELKIEQYKIAVEPIVTSSMRVWVISSFRFWDINQDGIICSKDIFAMYQTLDTQQTRLKQNFNVDNHKGYQIIIKLKEILEELRKMIIETNFDLQLQKQTKSQGQEQDKYEIKYLQEALIRKKQLKYSDLILILGHNIKSSTKQAKKSVIETTKQLNMKFSSCYRYSFLATDHNEQTRQDREHIQNLKQQLRNEKIEIKKKQKEHNLLKDKIAGINYKTYYQRECYVKIKAIILDLFAIKFY